MVGEDTSSSLLAQPPRLPLQLDVAVGAFHDLEADLTRATQEMRVTRWFWGEGVCLLALWRAAEARGGEPSVILDEFLAAYAAQDPVLEHVNNLAPGAFIAELHARAPRERTARLLEDGIHWYRTSPAATRHPNGAFEHWPGGVWADTVYMAGEFLLRAGRTLDRPELVQEAVTQWLAHAEILQHEQTGLFVHGTHRGERIDCFWGRANAWLALAGADLLALAADAEGIGEVAERLERQLLALAALQPDHGVWDVLVDGQSETRGILETSAAAGIGAAMLRAASRLDGTGTGVTARLFRSGESAVLGALAYVNDGVLERTSAGTVLQLIPFGYSVIRDDRIQPWGQGLALEAIAAWNETAAVRSRIEIGENSS